MKDSMDRRDFLKVSCAGAGLMLAFSLGNLPENCEAASMSDGSVSANSCEPNAWIRITPDNVVTFMFGKSELGQGTWTGLAMIMGDELDLDWADIRAEAAPARDPYKDPVSGVQITGGSTGVRNMYEAMSKASATVRAMLVSAAATSWKVPETELRTEKGAVIHDKTGRKMTYGELCGAASKGPIPTEAPVKSKDRLHFVGKSMPRLDSVDKINGRAIFGIDFCMPGMLYSTLERPPVYGANLLAYDKEAPLKIPGVKLVVPVKDGVAVLATDIEAAWRGRAALDAKWDTGSQPSLDDAALEKSFFEAMLSKGLIAKNTGDVDKALETASKRIFSEYSVPFVAHASIEPHNCVAHVQADRCDVWVPTQAQTRALDAAISESGLPAEKVHIHTLLAGGGFGGKIEVYEVAEAVRISRASGHIVKHMWTRAEDFQNDCFRPGSLHRVEAGLDAQGNLDSWKHKVVTPPIMERIMPSRVKDGIDPSAIDGIANMTYSIPNFQNEYVRLQTPILNGFWRAVGNTGNTFVVESFIDEMARLANRDPLEFRLQMLKDDPRSARVLKKVAEVAGWDKPLPEGMGRGIAQRFCFGSYCAQVAEVSVDKNTGAVKVHRIVVALDPGQVVNPDSVIAQIEGGVIIALSVALKERVAFAKGGVATSSFSGYPILTMSETPKIESHLIAMGDKIGGIGEPPVPPTAPAVANAVCSAIGVRVRKLPMTPETVLAAMKKRG